MSYHIHNANMMLAKLRQDERFALAFTPRSLPPKALPAKAGWMVTYNRPTPARLETVVSDDSGTSGNWTEPIAETAFRSVQCLKAPLEHEQPSA